MKGQIYPPGREREREREIGMHVIFPVHVSEIGSCMSECVCARVRVCACVCARALVFVRMHMRMHIP